MTAALAKKAIQYVLNKVLSQETRSELDKNIHILDLSKKTVLISNGYKDSNSFSEAYLEFIDAVNQNFPAKPSLDAAFEYVLGRRGSCVYKEYLVSLNFDASRKAITTISKSIPNNPYFGVTFRERSLEELLNDKGLDLKTSSLGELKGRAFLLKSSGGGEVSIVQKVTSGRKSRYEFVPLFKVAGNTKVVDVSESGVENTNKTAAQFYGSEVDISPGKTNIADRSLSDKIYIKKTYLSLLDLGHAFSQINLGARSPLGEKLVNSSKYSNLLGNEAKNIIDKYNKELSDLHSAVEYTFHNTAADSAELKTYSKVGYVVLSVQHYKKNNEYSINEGRILKNLTKELSNLAIDLPGSNTIKQDLAQKVLNNIIEILGGKSKDLVKHKPVTGKLALPSVKIRPVSGGVKGPPKQKLATTKPSILRNVRGQFTSLASLQTLLNLALHDQIKRNMGTGNRRDVLNYRTGRFAESVKVERLSQSREGMITAFYTYMKNPYATFSEGGRQSSPRSRDPKLLISKSIREVLQTQVKNRMRAVLV